MYIIIMMRLSERVKKLRFNSSVDFTYKEYNPVLSWRKAFGIPYYNDRETLRA